MKKLLIVLLATAPLFAMAEARYRVYFHNSTHREITLIYKSSSCMHGRGNDDFIVPAGGDFPANGWPMNLVDSNAAFTCNNSEKSVTWYIKGAPEKEIKFRHFRAKEGDFSSGTWVTRIDNNRILSDAQCDGSYCNNRSYPSSSKDMTIVLTLYPQ